MTTPSGKKFLFYLPLIVLPFLIYWQIGLMQHTMKWDMLDQFFPYRYFISECVDAGAVPSWNPYQFLGSPFHADPQTGFWYPIAWLLALTAGYDIYVMNFEFILHICFAGVGFFLLLTGFGIERKTALLFSLAYQCCGLFVNNAQHLTWIIALAWLPFVVHYYFRMVELQKLRYAVAAALFMMLMLTGGYPIFTVITNYFLGIVFLIHVFNCLREKNHAQLKSIVALNVVLYGVFLLLASGYIVSLINAMPHISRGAGLTLQGAMEGALPVKALVSLLFPFATTKNRGVFSTDLSMLNVYIGLISLIFATASLFYFKIPKVRLFVIFGIICLLAALGDATPVRGFLYHYFPAMDKFRFPSIFRAFFMFSFLVAGALAFQKSLEHWDGLRRYFLSATALLAMVLIGTHFFVLEDANHFVKFPSLFNVDAYLSYFLNSNIYQRIAIQSLVQLAIALLIVAVFLFVKKPQKLVTALLLITLADLFLSVQFNLSATAISETKASRFQHTLNRMPKGFPAPPLIPIRDVPTYDKGFYPSWYNQNTFTKMPTFRGFNSFQLTDFGAFYSSATRDSVLRHPVVFPEPAAQSQQVQITRFYPDEIEVKYFSEEDARLTLLQSAYPGWKAFVDGSPVTFVNNPIPFLTIAVPKGAHNVRFSYAPPYLVPTMWMAGLSFLVAFLYLLIAYFKR